MLTECVTSAPKKEVQKACVGAAPSLKQQESFEA